MQIITDPKKIEERSMEIIEETLGGKEFPPKARSIVKRVIHTTADFDYAEQLRFSEGAVEKALAALQQGATIVTDTQMVKAGIRKNSADALGCAIHCFISSEDVAKKAEREGTTRAKAAVDYAVETLEGPLIFAIGNAPTALLRLQELIMNNVIEPALIIGVPVGFVNVVESKQLIMNLEVPFIVAEGRKGGSNVAAAICNALLYQIVRK